MAKNLGKTLIQQVSVKYPSLLDQYENRVVETGLLTAVLEMNKSTQSIISPDLAAKAKKSQGVTIKVPVVKKGAGVQIKRQRTCKVKCAESESGYVNVVWKTVAADLCIVPGQYVNNLISKQFDFNKKLDDIVEAFRTTIEEDLESVIDTAKSKVYNSGLVGSLYQKVGDAIQVKVEDLPFFFGNIASINKSDNFKGNVKVIGSSELMGFVDQYMNQGAGNAKNTAYQFPGKDFRFTNGITNGAGVLATAYWMPDGAMGLLTRTDVDSQNKHVATSGTRWWEERLNGLPFVVGVKYDSECADKSTLIAQGLGHLTATMVEHYQFSFDYAVIEPYISKPGVNASPIRKVEIKK